MSGRYSGQAHSGNSASYSSMPGKSPIYQFYEYLSEGGFGIRIVFLSLLVIMEIVAFVGVASFLIPISNQGFCLELGVEV